MQIVEKALGTVGCCKVTLGLGFSWLLAAMMLYGTLQGRSIADLLELLVAGEDLSLLGGPLLAWFLLAAGPVLEIQGWLEVGGVPGLIFGSILLASVAYYLWAATSKARSAVHWQEALATVRAGGRPVKVPFLQPGWLAIGGIVTLLAGLLVVVPLTGFLTMNDALNEMKAADDLVDLERVVEENPMLGLHGSPWA